MLEDKIQQDIIISLKKRETETVSLLRMISSLIKNRAIELQKEVSDDEVMHIIQKYIKMLDEESSFAQAQAKHDTVEKNERQKRTLTSYIE